MEVTCTRCHQAILAENCYCPVCGLPQLVYPVEVTSGQTPQQRWDGTGRDAGCVDWKPALRTAMLLAIPAGVLSSDASQAGRMGLFWMTMAAVCSVALYMRSQRPAWITIGAGARIGLVTGLLAGWLAFGVSSCALFVQRFLLHQSSQIDVEWKTYVEASQQFAAQMGISDAAQMQAQKALMLSPEGHAGFATFSIVFNAAFLLLFAAAGGALGARLVGRTRQPGV
jgi:hypothetical protein